ncbi:MAG: flavin reductase [Oscillospiraceae bacterium]|nr:flavin reductase [Oscillospiraceae bacterium]
MEPMTNDTAGFFTQQLFLIGTYNEDGGAHFAPISWVSFTWGPPSCLVLSINGRERKKQTAINIERIRLLSATIVTPDLLSFAEWHNRATAKEGAAILRETERGKILNVPLLKETKWSYECEIIKAVRIGACDTYFAAIRGVNMREDVRKLDFIDLREINPVIYSPGHYFTVGDYLGEIGDYAK